MPIRDIQDRFRFRSLIAHIPFLSVSGWWSWQTTRNRHLLWVPTGRKEHISREWVKEGRGVAKLGSAGLIATSECPSASAQRQANGSHAILAERCRCSTSRQTSANGHASVGPYRQSPTGCARHQQSSGETRRRYSRRLGGSSSPSGRHRALSRRRDRTGKQTAIGAWMACAVARCDEASSYRRQRVMERGRSWMASCCVWQAP